MHFYEFIFDTWISAENLKMTQAATFKDKIVIYIVCLEICTINYCYL